MRVEIKEKKIFLKYLSKLTNINNFNEINGICTDSREVKKNDIFVAIKGENFDGSDFINQAFRLGASYAIAKTDLDDKRVINVNDSVKFIGEISKLWMKDFKGKVIAVTGSNGKTTTKKFIAHILKNLDYAVCSLDGNFNSSIGVPLSIFSFPHKSPIENKKEDYESPLVYILELGASKVGDIEYLSSIVKPHYGVVTNISAAHLKDFLSLENIALEKRSIFNHTSEAKYEFDKNVRNIFGIQSKQDFVLKDINNDLSKLEWNPITFMESFEWQDQFPESWKYPIVSDVILRCMCMALTVCQDFAYENYMECNRGVSYKTGDGYTDEDGDFVEYYDFDYVGGEGPGTSLAARMEWVKSVLHGFEIPEGRGNSFFLKNGVLIIDDSYNANPESVKAAIDNISRMELLESEYSVSKYRTEGMGRRILVLGDMKDLGEREEWFHQNIASYCDKKDIDGLLCIGELSKITYDWASKNKIRHHFDNKKNLAKYIIDNWQSNDVYLFKGSRSMGLDKVIEELKNVK